MPDTNALMGIVTIETPGDGLRWNPTEGPMGMRGASVWWDPTDGPMGPANTFLPWDPDGSPTGEGVSEPWVDGSGPGGTAVIFCPEGAAPGTEATCNAIQIGWDR